MDKELEEFRRFGHSTVNYVANYFDTLSDRPITPLVRPGFLKDEISDAVPIGGGSLDEIMSDFDRYIMRGMLHWHHPGFHGYLPTGHSYPAILADLVCDATSRVGFSWVSDPACTELEAIVLDWLCKMIGLPEKFLNLSDDSKGGGCIHGSTSEAIAVSMITARNIILQDLKSKNPLADARLQLFRLVAYCSREAHSSFDKSAKSLMISVRVIDVNERFEMKAEELKSSILADKERGLIPMFVLCTLGTMSCCSYDPLKEIGPICEEFEIWLHVDAAYVGSAFVCTEYRSVLQGVEHANSFSMNPSKWLLVSFDCCCHWVEDKYKLINSFIVDPLYLQHEFSDIAIDYRHWGITLSRRFRSLKLWFVIRCYGVEGLRKHIREHVRLAKMFESLVRRDERFTVENEVTAGVVCFRLKDSNDVNKNLLFAINFSRKLHMVSVMMGEKYVIRFVVCSADACEDDITFAWKEISSCAEKVMKDDPKFEIESNLDYDPEIFAKTLEMRCSLLEQ